MKIKKLPAAVLALVLLSLIGRMACRRIQDRRDSPRRDGMRSVPVQATPVTRDTLVEEGAFRGSLIARSQFVVAPKVPGRLQKLTVDIGDEVRRGDLIALLDSEEYALQVAQARAELDVSRAALEEAESASAVAASALARIRELHREQIASDSDLDDVEAQMKAAEARVKLVQAQIRQREASTRSAEVRLDYTRLYAEWDDDRSDIWLVAKRFADEGSMLRANDPIVSIVEIGTLKAIVHAIERDFPAVAPGQIAVLRTDAFPGTRFEGTVQRRAPVLDEGSRHARIEIEVANPDGKLAPGMFVRARIRFDARENTPVIPLAALTRRNGREGVFLVDKETMTAHFIEVELGIRTEKFAELLNPELDGMVITLGHHLLEDGGKVALNPHDYSVSRQPVQSRSKGRDGAAGGGS